MVHGFGASGVGGAIKEEMAAELPRLAKAYRFKVYGVGDKARIPRELKFDPRGLSQGSSLVVFRKAHPDKEREFRPNYRNLKRVKVAPPPGVAGQKLSGCRHIDRQLLTRGPSGNTYKCRTCGRTFLVYGH